MININNHDELNSFFRDSWTVQSELDPCSFPSLKFNTKIFNPRIMKWPFLIEFLIPDGKFDASTILMGLMNILLVGPIRVLSMSTNHRLEKKLYSHGILFISGVQFIQIK